MSSKSGGGGLTVFAGLGVLFGAVIGCGLVGLALSDATRAATAAAGSGLTRLASDNRDAVNVGFIIVTAGVPTLALLGAVVALAVWAVRALWYVKPDQAGRLPLTAQQHATDTGLVVTARSLDAYHQTQLAAASNPRPAGDVRIYRPVVGALPGARPQVETPALPQPVAAPMLPGPVELHQVGHTPTLQSILLGLTASGPVAVPASHLMHTLALGSTGGGKSNLFRLTASQLLAAGGDVRILDPHAAAVDQDAQGDGDWTPIYNGATLLAYRPGEIRAALADLERELLTRLELRHQGQPVGRAWFIYLDELPAMAAAGVDPMPIVARLLREGRKVKLYSMLASQTGVVKVIGGDRTVLDNVKTMAYSGGDGQTARRLLGVKTIDETQLGRGVSLLKCAALPAPEPVRIPWASDQAVYSLLGGGGRPARAGGSGVAGGGDRGGSSVAGGGGGGVYTGDTAYFAYPTPPAPVVTRQPVTPQVTPPPAPQAPPPRPRPDPATARNVGPTPTTPTPTPPAPSWPIGRRALTEAEATEVRRLFDARMSKNELCRLIWGGKDTVVWRYLNDALAAAPTTTKASGE